MYTRTVRVAYGEMTLIQKSRFTVVRNSNNNNYNKNVLIKIQNQV